jgi:hypothetical protein
MLFLLDIISLHEFVAIFLNHIVLLFNKVDLFLKLLIGFAEVEHIPGYELACVLELVHGQGVFLYLCFPSLYQVLML